MALPVCTKKAKVSIIYSLSFALYNMYLLLNQSLSRSFYFLIPLSFSLKVLAASFILCSLSGRFPTLMSNTFGEVYF